MRAQFPKRRGVDQVVEMSRRIDLGAIQNALSLAKVPVGAEDVHTGSNGGREGTAHVVCGVCGVCGVRVVYRLCGVCRVCAMRVRECGVCGVCCG